MLTTSIRPIVILNTFFEFRYSWLRRTWPPGWRERKTALGLVVLAVVERAVVLADSAARSSRRRCPSARRPLHRPPPPSPSPRWTSRPSWRRARAPRAPSSA
eukprot:3017405-Prymnesium_polylepis.1